MLVRVEQAARADLGRGPRRGREPPDGTRRLVGRASPPATALDAAYTCAKDCIQILGGIGFTWEHDAHLYLRRALVARAAARAPATATGCGPSGSPRGGARRELRLELPAGGRRRTGRAARAVIDGVARARPGAPPAGPSPPPATPPRTCPPPYGLGAGPVQQLAVQQELAAAGVRLSDLGIATWVVPSLIAYGTDGAAGALSCCRPCAATSCGASCSPSPAPDPTSPRCAPGPSGPRTAAGGSTARRCGRARAQWADYGILLARTDPDAPKHKGLTYFVVDMKNTDGIDIRPLKEITGDSLFNEVYFDDVLLPADAVVGEVDDGWQVARNTLGNERVHMADQLTFDTGLEALIAPGRRAGRRVPRADRRAGRRGARARLHRAAHHPAAGVRPGTGRGRLRTQARPDRRTSRRSPSSPSNCSAPRARCARAPGERAVHGFLHVPLPDHRGRHHPGPAQCRRRAHPRPAQGLRGDRRMKAYIVGVGMTKFEKPEIAGLAVLGHGEGGRAAGARRRGDRVRRRSSRSPSATASRPPRPASGPRTNSA